ncbi:MAG: hypothetical protein HYV03_04035 [Deltaproteobacteria bacterium]|nr:hypothetical protein [Deltaproteobacteria bacterium]
MSTPNVGGSCWSRGAEDVWRRLTPDSFLGTLDTAEVFATFKVAQSDALECAWHDAMSLAKGLLYGEDTMHLTVATAAKRFTSSMDRYHALVHEIEMVRQLVMSNMVVGMGISAAR